MNKSNILLLAAGKAKLDKVKTPTPVNDGVDLEHLSYSELLMKPTRQKSGKAIDDWRAISGIPPSDETTTAKAFLWFWELKRNIPKLN